MKRRILCLCLLVFALALLLALPVAAEETKTIKAGTYRFNDVLTQIADGEATNIEIPFTCTFNNVTETFDVTTATIRYEGLYQEANTGSPVGSLGYVSSFEPWSNEYMCTHGVSWKTNFISIELVEAYIAEGLVSEEQAAKVLAFLESGNLIYGEGIQTITITTDSEVSADFYEWFTANAKPLLDNECTNYTDAVYACECDVSLGSAWNGPEIYWSEDGVTIYHDTCGRCGITINYAVWDDHDYMQTVIGTELYNVCQNCADRVLIGDYVPDNDGNEGDAACSHTYVTTVIRPTCEVRGYTWYECAKCSQAFQADFVDPLPHQYEMTGKKDPTCTTSGMVYYACQLCGVPRSSDEGYLEPLGHSWKTVSSILGDNDMITTKSECERCHVTKTETFPTAAGQAQNWLLTVIRGLFSGGIDIYETVANGIEIGGVTLGMVIIAVLIVVVLLLLLAFALKVLG